MAPAAVAARRQAMELRELEALADALFASAPRHAHAENFGEAVVVTKALHWRRDALALARAEHAEAAALEEQRREAERAAVQAIEARKAAKAEKLAAVRRAAEEARRAAVAAKLDAVLAEKQRTQRVRIQLGTDAAPVKKQVVGSSAHAMRMSKIKPAAFSLNVAK
jgi:hypothetical protein